MRWIVLGIVVLGCGPGFARHPPPAQLVAIPDDEASLDAANARADEEAWLADKARREDQERRDAGAPVQELDWQRAEAAIVADAEQNVATDAHASLIERTRAREADETRARDREIERSRQRAEADATAREHGFERAIAGQSIAEVLEWVIRDAVPLASLRTIAIQSGALDEALTAQPIPGGALFFPSSGDIESGVRVMVRTRSAVYDGTPFTTLGLEWVKVTGLFRYRTAAGVRAEAFVVERAW